MKLSIRKYEKDGWQIWNTDEEPFIFDISGESKFFVIALIKFIWNLIFDNDELQ